MSIYRVIYVEVFVGCVAVGQCQHNLGIHRPYSHKKKTSLQYILVWDRTSVVDKAGDAILQFILTYGIIFIISADISFVGAIHSFHFCTILAFITALKSKMALSMKSRVPCLYQNYGQICRLVARLNGTKSPNTAVRSFCNEVSRKGC